MKEPQSPTLSSRTRICASGDRLRFVSKSHRHHHPTECTQASQIPPGRGTDGLSEPLEIHIGDGRWCTVGVQRKKFARAKGDLQIIHKRCKIRATFSRGGWRLSMVFRNTESLGKVPKFTAEQWLERFGTCWYRSDNRTPADIRSGFQGHCILSFFSKNMIGFSTRMDKCNFRVERCDCRRKRQERKQTSMLLFGRASSEEQGSS